jgi:hypothetical protein
MGYLLHFPMQLVIVLVLDGAQSRRASIACSIACSMASGQRRNLFEFCIIVG